MGWARSAGLVMRSSCSRAAACWCCLLTQPLSSTISSVVNDLASKYEVRRLKDAGITDANKSDAVAGIKRDLGVASNGGECHGGHAGEAIDADVDLVAIALAEVTDEVSPVVWSEDEGISPSGYVTGGTSGGS